MPIFLKELRKKSKYRQIKPNPDQLIFNSLENKWVSVLIEIRYQVDKNGKVENHLKYFLKN